MARNRKPTPTKAVIIKIASELFFANGFTKTTSTEICKKAEISAGNLTFYFPTKEHILAVLVKMMLDFQWQELEIATGEGKSSLLAYCLELTTMVAISDELPQMQEFFAAAYAHPMTLELIRADGEEKIKQVFTDYTEGWDEERFLETETLIAGIKYASLMRTAHTASLEHRIEGALNAIMLLIGVPESVRKVKIEKVLAMDYRALSKKIYSAFHQYVTDTNEHALEEVLKYTKIRTYK